MITFEDVQNDGHQAQCTVSVTEGVNGEKSLSGVIYFGQEVKDGLDKGWSLTFMDEDYVVITFNRNDSDNTVEFEAVQAFFYKMSVSGFYETWNGSHTFTNYLDSLFANSGYQYVNEATVPAFEKQNWGMKDKLTLFNDIIDQAGVEFYVKGKLVYIKPQIGSDLSTVVRKKFNLNKAEIETDASSFATYGRGYGAYDDPEDHTSNRLMAEYKSPLYYYYYAKFGAIEAAPVSDERYSIYANLLQAVQSRVDDSWSISLTLDLVDLQNAGYKYALATPGDKITVVDEGVNFDDEVRIVKVVSDYDGEGNRTKVQVTCGDLSGADKQKTTQATIANVVAGNSTIPNTWLTQQVQIATDSLLSARTELQFTDAGIVATDKGDANKVVLLNSNGLGVSTDGGKTFKTAITADMINGNNINITNLNAASIIAGIIEGKNLSINLDTGEVNFKSGSIKSLSGNFSVDVDSGEIASSNNGGNEVKLSNGSLDYREFYTNKDLTAKIGLNASTLFGLRPAMAIQGTDAIALAVSNPLAAEISKSQFSSIMIDRDELNLYGNHVGSKTANGSTSYYGANVCLNGQTGSVTADAYPGTGLFAGTISLTAHKSSDGSSTNDNNVQISSDQTLFYNGDVTVWENFTVIGTKNAATVTRDGVRRTPAYEMAESYFGDMGESTTDSLNQCKVPIDELFSDTVNTSVPYQVFLQSYSSAHVWVSSREETYFVVQSDSPSAPFAWEIKAKRRGYENDRLVKTDMSYTKYGEAFGYKPTAKESEENEEGSESDD